MGHRKTFVILSVTAVIMSLLYLFWGLNPTIFRFALARRLPNLIAILIVGPGIAFSTVLFQTVANNRILTPSVLGLDSLYTLLQTGLIFVLGSYAIVELGSLTNFFLAGILMVVFSLLLFRLMFKGERQNMFLLLMMGIVFGTFFTSLSSFMQRIMDATDFLIIQNRTLASFNHVSTSLIVPSLIVLAMTVAFMWKEFRHLDVLALNRDHAINLGLNYQKSIRKILIVVAIFVSVTTALIGPITFLGLMVVNLAHQLFNDHRHKVLIAGSMLISVIALAGGQFFVERIFQFNTTIGVIINFFGGLYFIYILLAEASL